MTNSANQTEQSRDFAHWCVMTHARPVVIKALRLWGLGDAALWLEKADSLTALKMAALDADSMVKKYIRFVPLRRDLSNALNTLHAAATFASRGDAANTRAIVIGVFTNAASATTWRKPWQRFSWRKQRSAIIAQTRHEQSGF